MVRLVRGAGGQACRSAGAARPRPARESGTRQVPVRLKTRARRKREKSDLGTVSLSESRSRSQNPEADYENGIESNIIKPNCPDQAQTVSVQKNPTPKKATPPLETAIVRATPRTVRLHVLGFEMPTQA